MTDPIRERAERIVKGICASNMAWLDDIPFVESEIRAAVEEFRKNPREGYDKIKAERDALQSSRDKARDEALEEAAKVAESHDDPTPCGVAIAGAVRALKGKAGK